MLARMFPPLRGLLSLNAVAVVKYRMFWQPLTYMFVHGNPSHLIFNQLGLLFFGLSVERSIGSKEFLLFYLLTGTLAGLASLGIFLAAGEYYAVLLGSSGAVYATLLAYAVIFPRSRIFIWGVLPVSAPLLVLIYAGIALFSQTFNRGSGIAHVTHLAGFAAAWLYLVIRMGVNPLKVWGDIFR
jgi:membrane associated rhomboid family serine protease